jgi:ABC-type multidrug transport system fused ATPase/permease subunit
MHQQSRKNDKSKNKFANLFRFLTWFIIRLSNISICLVSLILCIVIWNFSIDVSHASIQITTWFSFYGNRSFNLLRKKNKLYKLYQSIQHKIWSHAVNYMNQRHELFLDQLLRYNQLDCWYLALNLIAI